MNVTLAALVVVAFAVTLERLDLPDHAREVGRRAVESLEVLRDPSLADEAKEAALRRHAVRLFGLLGILVGGSALALGLPLAGVWLLDRAALASWTGVLAVLERIDFLVTVTILGLILYVIVRRFDRT